VPRRLTNVVLLASTGTLVSTGLVAWLLPEWDAAPLYVMHRLAGILLVLALVWKYAIARRSLARRLPRRERSIWAGLAAAVLLLPTVGLGIAWTIGLASFDRPWAYSALNLHVFAGLALAVLVVAHSLARIERRRLLGASGRRALLRLGVLGAATVVATAALDRVSLDRRPSGSRHAGSFTGNDFPLTSWTFDALQSLDPATWRLAVTGGVARPARLTLDDLQKLPRREATEVLDCTGGWWTEQRWSGVSLAELLAAHGATDLANVEVISVTGHRWLFERAEAERALLATHVGDAAISAGHGYPLRLVVPGSRGFKWIKWVGEVSVTRQ
jgi:DMSO/TMAO reductase YedYZ molybdopterin-dependent catalytic subunit